MSAVLPHLEITPQRPDWLAGAPGFEPGNGGIKIQVVRIIYQRAFRKSAEIGPQSVQEVSGYLGTTRQTSSGYRKPASSALSTHRSRIQCLHARCAKCGPPTRDKRAFYNR